ncbi:TonB-dependent receptor domain-containing protein [Granulicella cerasi]|uniref:TonB-dependent receptor domain-containing protein n=1 Tax=Granulicella cerasi TaxID=741063 RepID=A0ABW1ZBK7_9BACT|nr:TonB-dependent receptor [Granulicella cerasi]
MAPVVSGIIPGMVSSLHAQVDSARLSGTVTDSTGAVLPNATITVKNSATGFTRSAVATGQGTYVLNALPVGTYTVAVQAAGFGEYKRTVTLTVGAQSTVDAKLGASSTEIVVATADDAAFAVNTTTQEVSTTITPKEMIDLPSLTRNPYDFVILSGVTASDPNGTTARGVGVALNGQRSAGTEVLLDGVENADNYDATVGITVPLDAVDQYSIIVNGFDAQYGRASGGIVNLATRSGSNAFHGSLYEFNRISALASNTFAENAANAQARIDGTAQTPRDHFTRNQFGYSVGGPIIKDKLFFFNNYEWNRVRSSGQQTFSVPTAAFLATTSAATQSFFNTYGKIDPSTKLGSPLAANTNFQTATVSAPINAGAGDPVNAYFGVTRFDYTLNNKINMYFRAATYKDQYFPGYVSLSPYTGYNTTESDFNQAYLFSINYIITPSLVSSTKISFNRVNVSEPLGSAGLTPSAYLTSTGGVIGGNSVALPGYLPTSPGNAIPFGGPQNTYQFVEDATWTKGRHTVKFGGQFIQIRDNRVFGAYESAVEEFSASTSTATGITNLTNGTVGSFEVALNPQGKLPCSYAANSTLTVTAACSLSNPASSPSFERQNTFNDGSVYLEDQWKLTPRLTVNAGLRWEYYGVQHNNNRNLESNFYLGSGSNLAQQVQSGQVKTTPNSPDGGLIKQDFNNFAPRVGFAYDVFGNGKTAIRGGYGISYERNFGNVTYNTIQNPPNYAGVVVNNVALTNSNFGPFAGSTGTTPLYPASLRTLQQNMPTAYTHQYSLTIEHEVAAGNTVGITYSGALGKDLYAIANLNDYGMGTFVGRSTGFDTSVSGCYFSGSYCNNRVNNQYAGINMREANAYSNYNAMNVYWKMSALKKYGVQFVANYTLAHAMDNLSSTFSEGTGNDNLGYTNAYAPNLDYGNADFDIRHQFSIGGIYQPAFLEFRNNHLLHTIAGGLEFAPIAVVRTGSAFTIYDCTNGFTTCPRIQAGPGLAYKGSAPSGQNFDSTPSHFTYVNLPATAANTFVNAEGLSEFADNLGGVQNIGMDRNQFYGPKNVSFDMGVYKNFAFGADDRYKVQLRSEFYNILNHSNYYPIVYGGVADFSQVTNVGVAKGSPNASPSSTDERRNVQLAVRLQF